MERYEFIEELKDNISSCWLGIDFTKELKEKYEENFGEIDPEFTLDDLYDACRDLSEEWEDYVRDQLAWAVFDYLDGITKHNKYPEDAPGQLHLFDNNDTPIK